MAYPTALKPKVRTYMSEGGELYDAGKKLEAIRFFHEDYNEQPVDMRIAWKNPIERWIREVMNKNGVRFEGHVLNNWRETSDQEDMLDLRDAQDTTSLGNRDVFAQTKYRQPENGSDILYCLMQPYPGNADIARQMLREKRGLLFGRDHRCQTQIYATMSESWLKLKCLDTHKSIKPKIDRILDEFLNSDAPLEADKSKNVFRASWNRRFELRCFADADSGVLKVCAFLPPNLFEEGEVQFMDMGEVPDYLFEPFKNFM